MSPASGQEHETEREHGEGSAGDPNGPGETLHELAQTAARDVNRAAHLAQRERLPRGRALTRGIVLAGLYALGLVALLLLAAAAHTYALLPFDLPFTRELQEHPTPVVSAFLTFISALGYFPYAEIIVVVCVLALLLLRLRLEAIFLLATLLVDALGALIKDVVARHRPSPSLVHVAQHLNSPSFPSGHTLHYTVFYGFLAFVLITSFRPSWWRNVLVAICFALIALVGISRVYLGEHWLTDVLGGYLLGGLFLLPLVAAYLWARAHFNSATLRPLRHPARPM